MSLDRLVGLCEHSRRHSTPSTFAVLSVGVCSFGDILRGLAWREATASDIASDYPRSTLRWSTTG